MMFRLYLWVVTGAVFLPAAGLAALLRWVRRIFQDKRESYFISIPSQGPKFWRLGKMRCYHLWSAAALLLLWPCFMLGRRRPKKLFLPGKKPHWLTPNKVAALVINQVVSNLKGVAGSAKQNRADYLFALQPSLMYTGPVTEGDKIFYESRNKTQIGGFAWSDFVKAYYGELIRTLKSDTSLQNHFADLSAIFASTKDQMFVDTMHMGSLGQEKCAQVLAEEVWKKINSESPSPHPPSPRGRG